MTVWPNLVAAVIVMLAAVNTSVAESPVTTTETGSNSVIELPEDVKVSSLLLWTHYENTTVHLQVFSSYWYATNFTLTKPKLWHIITIFQPVREQNRTVFVQAPVVGLYVNLEYTRVTRVEIASNNPTSWIFCPDAYACALLPPPADTPNTTPTTVTTTCRSERSEGGGGRLLAPLLVVSLLLVVALVALTALTCYRKKDIFHVYEDPVWPPLPPALPYPVLQVLTNGDPGHKTDQSEATINNKSNGKSEDNSQPMSGVSGNYVTTPQPMSDVSQDKLSSDWSRERHMTTIFPDEESVNSLYGLILPDRCY